MNMTCADMNSELVSQAR